MNSRKFYVILLVSFVITALSAYTYNIYEKEVERKLLLSAMLPDDRLPDYTNGKHELMNEDGNAVAMVSFKDGKREEMHMSFYGEGHMRQQSNYVQGKRIGYQEVYYDNGQLYSMVFYINGLKDGMQHILDKKGQVVAEVPYLDGQLLKGTRELQKGESELYLEPTVDLDQNLEVGRRDVPYLVVKFHVPEDWKLMKVMSENKDVLTAYDDHFYFDVTSIKETMVHILLESPRGIPHLIEKKLTI